MLVYERTRKIKLGQRGSPESRRFRIVKCLPGTNIQEIGLLSPWQVNTLSVHSISANRVCDILTKICQKSYLNVEVYYFTSLPLIPVKIL